MDAAPAMKGLPTMVKLTALLASLVALAVPLVMYAAPPAVLPSVESPAAMQMGPGDLVDTAANDGRFTTLVAAVQAAGLVDTLKSDGALYGPFTVFAPTDEAFAKLPAGTIEALLANPAQLSEILLYHVVPGAVAASDVMMVSSAQTAQGQAVTVSMGEGGVLINESRVLITDVMASNGIIHVIDAVLLPPRS
jgi:uncharacterized surface protein with fasciclin (FAS1) repeats